MIKNLLDDSDESSPESPESKGGFRSEPAVLGLFDSVDDTKTSTNEPRVFSAPAESAAETARRSGIAWSLGIAFFSAVGFLLILGWGADLLFGTSPWGVVIGIVIGALIGFFQLFRMSSQIFRQ